MNAMGGQKPGFHPPRTAANFDEATHLKRDDFALSLALFWRVQLELLPIMRLLQIGDDDLFHLEHGVDNTF